jgi:hypothetical protein
MDPRTTVDPAARWRAFVRCVLGKPGSWRKWLVFSAVWMVACVCVCVLTGDLVVLFVGVLAELATLPVRAMLVGDEDEVNAALDRGIIRTLREGAEPPEDPAFRTDPADWFTRGGRRFDDVPLPPSAEDAPVGQSDPPDGRAPSQAGR